MKGWVRVGTSECNRLRTGPQNTCKVQWSSRTALQPRHRDNLGTTVWRGIHICNTLCGPRPKHPIQTRGSYVSAVTDLGSRSRRHTSFLAVLARLSTVHYFPAQCNSSRPSPCMGRLRWDSALQMRYQVNTRHHDLQHELEQPECGAGCVSNSGTYSTSSQVQTMSALGTSDSQRPQATWSHIHSQRSCFRPRL